MKKETKLPDSVTLSDGRVVTKKDPTIREITSVGTYAGKDENLSKMLSLSVKILVDGKKISFEDYLDKLKESDLEKIMDLFISEEDLKNLSSQ